MAMIQHCKNYFKQSQKFNLFGLEQKEQKIHSIKNLPEVPTVQSRRIQIKTKKSMFGLQSSADE
jgi:hypothetical protein